MIIKNIRALLTWSISIFIEIKLTFIANNALIPFSTFWFCQTSLKSIYRFTLYNYIRSVIQSLETFLCCYIRAIIALENCGIAFAALLKNLLSFIRCEIVEWVMLRWAETCLALPSFIYYLIRETIWYVNR